MLLYSFAYSRKIKGALSLRIKFSPLFKAKWIVSNGPLITMIDIPASFYRPLLQRLIRELELLVSLVKSAKQLLPNTGSKFLTCCRHRFAEII